MFVDDAWEATHPGQCPYVTGSDEWKQWQRAFAESSRARDLVSNGGRAAAQQTARLDALKERLPKRTDAQRRHDELMAEVEEATAPQVVMRPALDGLGVFGSWDDPASDPIADLQQWKQWLAQPLHVPRGGIRYYPPPGHAAPVIIIDDKPVPGVRSVNLFATYNPGTFVRLNGGTLDLGIHRVVDDPEPDVKMIRGKPAGKVKNQTCPKHGQPRGSCRRCWR